MALRNLKQFLTYAGMMEGFPTTELNQVPLGDLVKKHTRNNDAPYLIGPAEKPIDIPQELRELDRSVTPSALPSITCIGQFTSSEPVRYPSYEMSALVVI